MQEKKEYKPVVEEKTCEDSFPYSKYRSVCVTAGRDGSLQIIQEYPFIK